MAYDPITLSKGVIQSGITKYGSPNPATLPKSALISTPRGFVPPFSGTAMQGNGEFIPTHANLSQPRVKSDFTADLMCGSPILGEFVDVIA